MQQQSPPNHAIYQPAGFKGNPAPMLQNNEQEWLRGPLSRDASYRIFVTGEAGVKEIEKLIKVLEAQKAVLED